MSSNKHSISNIATRRKLGTLASKTSASGTRNPHNTTALSQHTSKIEEKLAKLRSEIDDKKRTSTRQLQRRKKIDKPDPAQVNTFIGATKNSKMKVTGPVKNEEPVVEQGLREFLHKIGMEMYVSIMGQNGIDSLEILKQCKQKQLEEMGIPKGHALKIVIHIKKILAESTEKNGQQRESTHQSQSSHIKNKNYQKLQNKEAPLQIIIQTDEIEEGEPLIRKRRYFCLYCYQLCTEKQFCGEDCTELYQKMFKKYEDNLIKAENLFVHQNSGLVKQRQQQLKDAEEVNENDNQDEQGQEQFDYLNLKKEQDEDSSNQDEQSEEFDRQAYQQMLGIVFKARNQAQAQSYQSLGFKMLSMEEQPFLNSNRPEKSQQ